MDTLIVRGNADDYGKREVRYQRLTSMGWIATGMDNINAHLANGGVVLWNPSNL